MSTALYIRVSTDFQAEKGYSIEAQQDKLCAYCAINDIKEYEFYIDGGYSGSTLDRPAMQRLINDVMLKKLDTVIVVKLDRLSRRTKDTLYLIEDVFNKYDIRFISLSESLDTNSSNGKFFISIMSSVAQLERENIRERTMMGAQKKAEKGIKSRSARELLGYDYDRDTKTFKINENEAAQVRLIFEMYTNGKSVMEINRFMKSSSFTCKNVHWGDPKQIQLILDNETYTGKKFVYRGEFIDATNVEQIIDEKTFEKAKALRTASRMTVKRYDKSRYLLTGFVRCGYCSAPVRGYPTPHHDYYACYSRTGSHPHMNYAENCGLKYLRCNVIDEYIEKALKNIASSETNYKEAKADDTAVKLELKLLRQELEKLERKTSKLYDLYVDDRMNKDTLEKKLDEFKSNKAELENKILELQKPLITRSNAPTYSQIKTMIKKWDESSNDDKRHILKSLIDKIYLFNDKIVINWLF